MKAIYAIDGGKISDNFRKKYLLKTFVYLFESLNLQLFF